MRQLPSIIAVLQEGLADEERNEVLNKIKTIKGVLSASFNDTGKIGSVVYVKADRTQIETVEEKVSKISGVKKLQWPM